MDIKLFQFLDGMGDLPEDETPPHFKYREELERVGYVKETIDKGLIVTEEFYSDIEHTDLLVRAEYEYPFDLSLGDYSGAGRQGHGVRRGR